MRHPGNFDVWANNNYELMEEEFQIQSKYQTMGSYLRYKYEELVGLYDDQFDGDYLGEYL